MPVAVSIHPLFPSDLFPEVVQGYSTREGGQSPPPYASLNLGDHVGDDPDAVLANRRILSEGLGIPARRWVTAEQVHGGKVAVVEDGHAGRKVSGVDALVTDTPNLPLALMYADCVSLGFIDPARRVIGLAHAGWRGTVAEIGPKTVQTMKDRFGSRAEEIYAAIGPHIGPCCYTVGLEVAEQLRAWEGAIQEREGRFIADLGAANRAQLQQAGLKPDRILSSAPCTSCNTDRFFSYRREGATGRMSAVLMLRER